MLKGLFLQYAWNFIQAFVLYFFSMMTKEAKKLGTNAMYPETPQRFFPCLCAFILRHRKTKFIASPRRRRIDIRILLALFGKSAVTTCCLRKVRAFRFSLAVLPFRGKEALLCAERCEQRRFDLSLLKIPKIRSKYRAARENFYAFAAFRMGQLQSVGIQKLSS